MGHRNATRHLSDGGGTSVGAYSYRQATDSWWWSDEVYEIYGFQPREVVPTTALMRAHLDPRQFTLAEWLLAVSVSRTRSYYFRHSITDAQRRIRVVMVVGQVDLDLHTSDAVGLSGYFADVTDAERMHTDDAVTEALARSIPTRSVIEQAKGALAAVSGHTPDAAFLALTARSQLLNIKVRELADQVVQHLHNTTPASGLQSTATDILGAGSAVGLPICGEPIVSYLPHDHRLPRGTND